MLTAWSVTFCERALAASPAPASIPVRDVRVLLASGASGVRVTSSSPLTILGGDAQKIGEVPPGGESLFAAGGNLTIRWNERTGLPAILKVQPRPDAPLEVSFDRESAWSEPAVFLGVLRFRAAEGGGLEVINEVDLEHYVGCVVGNEVWPTFDVEAFRAQSIVARTFVLYQMTRRPDAAVDVSATQGSQVYRGVRDDAVGRKGVEAAEYTRGLVLTYDDKGAPRIFCTYYSAACGGASQPAKLLGAEGDVEPLRGGVNCDHCKIAPGDTYRWGPVSVAVDELIGRLVERYPEMAALGRVVSITPVDRTATGRPLSLRLTGSTGKSEDLIAERFRLAVGASVVKSTDCRIRVVGDEVIFDQGKGYGHGLGLCQWGMEGLARSGKQAAEILRYYYPGSQLTRAY
jgi:stage II sporulation protein D